MRKLFLTGSFLLIFAGVSFAQSLEANAYALIKENVYIKYQIKEKKGKKELLFRFKNKSKSFAKAEIKIGLYQNGILSETLTLNECMKKSFLDNWFRVSQMMVSEEIKNGMLESKDLELKITESNIELTDGC